MELEEIAEGVRAGTQRMVARAITIVEAGGPAADELTRLIGPVRQHPAVIGITGPPGAGKSTLIASLIDEIRASGGRVAVLAFDPSSPFSGGALLGDRIRMTRRIGDRDLFIRSMATRGHGGGLSAAALDTILVLGAAQFDTILVESVGVGQTEIGVRSVADLVVVVLNPGTGDEIQTLKAGVMEIGDLYVVNKGDLAGAEDLERALVRSRLASPDSTHEPPIVRTSALQDDGIAALSRAITERMAVYEVEGVLARRREARVVTALEDIAGDLFREWLRTQTEQAGAVAVPYREMKRRIEEMLSALSLSDRQTDSTAGGPP